MEINSTTFVPSGAAVTLAPDSSMAGNFPMPAVDSGNLDLVLTSSGVGVAWLSFAAGAPVGPTVPGTLAVPGGASVLLTANAATQAAAAANPAVQNVQAGTWQTATVVSALAFQKGQTITIQRGTATARAVF